MVKVKFEKKNNRITFFEIEGHAEAGEHGEDIVCSAISVLGQTAIIGLIEIAKINPEYVIESGYLSCKVPKDLSKEEWKLVQPIIDTIYLGFINVQRSYSEFVEIEELEV